MRFRLLSTLLLSAALAPMGWAEAEAPPATPPPIPSPSPAAEEPTPEPTPLPTPLPPEAIRNALKVDPLSIPGPGELMVALNKEVKPNLQSEYRPPIPTSYTSRAQIALNIGGLIADGYIALEAEDSQQIKNIGKDIITLAKSLGVSENVIARGNSIIDFAENNEWTTLKEELEATQNEVKLALEQQHDEDLVTLVTIGGWIRGTDVVSGWISANYTPAAAKLLRQPAIVGNLKAQLQALPEKIRSEELVETVSDGLDEIEAFVSFPPGQIPTPEDVLKLRAISSRLVEQIAKKKNAK